MSKVNTALNVVKDNRTAILKKGAQALAIGVSFAVSTALLNKRKVAVVQNVYGTTEETTIINNTPAPEDDVK
jgi:hypothetical protein